MGVAGAGKTTLGRALADELGWEFLKADDLHGDLNRVRMSRGEGLTDLDRDRVLENNAVFGSVNAGRAHYEDAARVLARADGGWLDRLVTRRVPVARWAEAFERRPDDVKVVLSFPA